MLTKWSRDDASKDASEHYDGKHGIFGLWVENRFIQVVVLFIFTKQFARRNVRVMAQVTSSPSSGAKRFRRRQKKARSREFKWTMGVGKRKAYGG